jgi:hypothetical protein
MSVHSASSLDLSCGLNMSPTIDVPGDHRDMPPKSAWLNWAIRPPPLRRADMTTWTAAADTECRLARRSINSLSVSAVPWDVPSLQLRTGNAQSGEGPDLGSARSVHSETLIGADSAIREREPAALATADPGFDRVAEKPACGGAISEFAGPLQVIPGDLE